MNKQKQLVYGITIGLIVSILVQHILFGKDPDYNILIQIRRFFLSLL